MVTYLRYIRLYISAGGHPLGFGNALHISGEQKPLSQKLRHYHNGGIVDVGVAFPHGAQNRQLNLIEGMYLLGLWVDSSACLEKMVIPLWRSN